MNDRIHLQPRDFVLYQQLATFQFHDLEIIDGWMGAGFGNFRFQKPVPYFQFRKMRFYGHVGGSPEVRLLPDPDSLHLFGPFSKRVSIVRRNNPPPALPHKRCLNAGGQNGILWQVGAPLLPNALGGGSSFEISGGDDQR